LTRWSRTDDAQHAPPDQRVALEAALLQLDASRPPDAFLDMLASEDPSVTYPAVERLIALTGSDQGLDVTAPVAQRAPALTSARDALLLALRSTETSQGTQLVKPR
jgi:hypothetical protein